MMPRQPHTGEFDAQGRLAEIREICRNDPDRFDGNVPLQREKNALLRGDPPRLPSFSERTASHGREPRHQGAAPDQLPP